jgi:hypothetical protein
MFPERIESICVLQTRSAVREAAAVFIRGTTFGWGRYELANWLVCHYSPCLVSDATVHPDGHVDAARATLSAASNKLDEERLESIVLDARCAVLRLLSDLTWPSVSTTLLHAAIAGGNVIRVPDRNGRSSWAPVGRSRMGLADRVSSLFIADALNTPDDYREVLLCRYCGELGFNREVLHDSACESALSVA